ncbi:MAG: hypothetical protein H8K03_12070 [Nitrospira sp.]
MARIGNFQLVVQTRDEDNAGSTNLIRLFSGFTEVANFKKTPPARGKAKMYFANVDLDYDQFLSNAISLAMTSNDAWAPRSAFLFGLVISNGAMIMPLAQNFFLHPNSWVSQDVSKGLDRWPMQSLARATPSDPLDTLIFCMMTADMANAESPGPFELSLFGNVGGQPVLVYQTVLATVGTQNPAERDGTYLTMLPIWSQLNFTADKLAGVQIVNRSDDSWLPADILLFAANKQLTKARLLSRWPIDGSHLVSQDPHDSETKTFRAHQAVAFPIRLDNLV